MKCRNSAYCKVCPSERLPKPSKHLGRAAPLALSLCFDQLAVALSIPDLALQERDRVERVNPVLSFFSFAEKKGSGRGSPPEPNHFQALLVVLVRLGVPRGHNLETTLSNDLATNQRTPKTSCNC